MFDDFLNLFEIDQIFDNLNSKKLINVIMKMSKVPLKIFGNKFWFSVQILLMVHNPIRMLILIVFDIQ